MQSKLSDVDENWRSACILLSGIVKELRKCGTTAETAITVLLHQKKSTVSVFTFPKDHQLPFLNSTSRPPPAQHVASPTCTVGNTCTTGNSHSGNLSNIGLGSDDLEIIASLSVLNMRDMLRKARKRLGRPKFEWTGAVGLAYKGAKEKEWPDNPIPGRKRFGTEVLSLILRLCLRLDENWCNAMTHELWVLRTTLKGLPRKGQQIDAVYYEEQHTLKRKRIYASPITTSLIVASDIRDRRNRDQNDTNMSYEFSAAV